MIKLIGDVDELLLQAFHEQVSHQLKVFPEKKELKILLSTEGGALYSGFAMYDAIRAWSENRGKTTVIATGACMSAGSMIILQAADVRLATPNTHLMIHFGQETNESPSESKHNKKLLRDMREILLSKTKKPSRTVSSWFGKDTYFDVQEALDRNLIDGVASLYEA